MIEMLMLLVSSLERVVNYLGSDNRFYIHFYILFLTNKNETIYNEYKRVLRNQDNGKD